MRKASLSLLLSILVLNCSQQQREGWSKRIEDLSGAEKQTGQKDTLNPDQFNLTKDKQQFIGLETTVVKNMTIDDIIELPAEIVSNPNNVTSVIAPISGKIISLPVMLGTMVDKNVIIAIIENPQNLGQRYEIRSPMQGMVTVRSSNLGEWIENGKQIAEITDYSDLQVLIRLFPDEQNKVKIGQAVNVEYNGIKVRGKITLISPTIDPVTRTIDVRAEITNSNSKLKINAYVQAQIFIGTKEGIVIPSSALINEETHYIVFVQQGDSFEKRYVEFGIRNGEHVEIISGLQEGDVVVTKGAYQLKNINFTSNPSET